MKLFKTFVFSVLIVVMNIIVYSQEDPYKPIVDVMPEPVGGFQAIYATIEYPDLAKKAGVQGKVYLLVYINEKGSVDDVKVIKGLGAGCDEAAIESLKKAKFTPGKLQGQIVKVKLTVPVIFKMK